MPENKNSFIKSKMNKDLDERLLPNNEYRDASNVAISRSEGSDVGALEAILGNTKVITGLDSTESVIGYFVDETNGFVYYFKTDFNGELNERPVYGVQHSTRTSINRFDINSNTYIELVSGFFLNFSKKYPIHGINLMENLLFWTDNRNQPRKINVDIAAGNNDYYITEDQISVCKFAPYIPLDFINLRSPLATQPSTMTRQQDADTTVIGSLQWSNVNLEVTAYSNGDPIPEATSTAEWIAYDAAETGAWCWYDFDPNGFNYGKFYNKWAVEDSRLLAPLGYTIPTLANWTALAAALDNTDVGKKIKSIKPWPVGGEGSNPQVTGFIGRPAGQVTHLGVFSGQGAVATSQGNFWQSDASADYHQVVGQGGAKDDLTKITNTEKGFGASVRLVRDTDYQWAGDPEFLTDKFAKFSYRFKFDDNEYSVIAPFSQDCFIPQQLGEFGGGTGDTDAAFRTTVVEFMQNEINNAVLNITLPSKDIITDYKIKEIDIIFKESDGLAYQVLETIDVNANFISKLNNTNIFQYDYQSTIPFKTLPQTEASRVYDKVPVRALAQEASGNRIIYGNYIQSYTAPLGLDYYADVDEKSLQTYTEYRNHSVKQNRNYQVGLVLADKYGRETDVVLSNYDNLLNASGNPQPGSNLYNTYKGSAFNDEIEDWMGDNLKLQFNNIIPEGENANGLSGFPGAYAEGNYYLTTSSETGAYFNDNSTQELLGSEGTVGNTVFEFTGLLNGDVSGNTLNVYVNNGSGWILQVDPTDYDVTSSSGALEITFASGLASDSVTKAEILFSGTHYKYTIKNMFANFATTYESIFGITHQGKYLRGLYKDYTQITHVDKDVSDIVTIKTKDEIATSYIFPVTTATPKTNATYDINPNGFYTYRVAVKQQQQEYYNVYLPGIVNGYPIEDDTTERGQTAFTTLIADNINKVPRNLQEVGPLDDQFNSDTRMWGRVTNTDDGKMEQYFPSTNADKVDLIGTITDVFPDITVGTTAGNLNEFAIFDFVSRPNVGKISTEAVIGIPEDDYVTGTPYPPNTNLAVYETAPVMSAIELFWETSTAGLISDVNYNIKNNTTEITGSTIEAASGGFDEADPGDTVITNEFFPTGRSGNITDTTATLLSVCSKYENGILNTHNRSAEFELIPHASNGSYKIENKATFYAGEDNATANFFEFTIQFTQSDGTLVNQNYNTTLTNVAPTITDNSSPGNPAAGEDVEIFNSITTAYGPTGVNGSARSTYRTLFPLQTNAGWSLSSLTIDGGSAITTNIDDYFVITQQAGKLDSTYGLQVKSAPNYVLVKGTAFVITCKLTDAGGLSDTTTVSVTVT